MEAAFAWIGQLANWLAAWIPHLRICRATHGGVKFVGGKHVRVIKPGLFVYWPCVTEIEMIPVVRQSLNLPPQRLVTKDGIVIYINLTVIYTIEDVKKALVDSYNHDDSAEDVALEATTKVVIRKTFAELREGLLGNIRDEITRAARTALRPFGLYVEKCRVSDFAQTRLLSHDIALPPHWMQQNSGTYTPD